MGKTLNKKTLGSTLIRVPPIAKQREVARRLDSAENVLSLLGREKNTLDDLVKSRFVAQQQIEKLQMLYDSLAQEYFGD